MTEPGNSDSFSITRILSDEERRAQLAQRTQAVQQQREEETQRRLIDWSTQLTESVLNYKKAKRERTRRKILAGLAVAFVGIAVSRQLPILFFLFAAIFGGAALADGNAKDREKLAETLSRTRDPRAVAALAIACRDGDMATKEVARRGLKSLLPSVRASDIHHISVEGNHALVDLLRQPDPEMQIAILRALQQIGDAYALPTVKWMAQQESPPAGNLIILVGGNDYSPVKAWKHGPEAWVRVRETALETLDYLQLIEDREKAKSTLLRPAEPVMDSQTLLRPAMGAGEVEESKLLRPIQADGVMGHLSEPSSRSDSSEADLFLTLPNSHQE